MAQGGDQDGASAQSAGTRQVDARIRFCIVTEQYFTGSNTVGGQAAIRLQSHTNIGCGAPRACLTDDLVAFAECNGGTCRSGERLGFFSNDADSWLQIKFSRVHVRAD